MTARKGDIKMLSELLKITRSYRRYLENEKITDETLRDIASAIRYAPSAANLQRVRVALVNNDLQNKQIFDTLGFAAYLKDWKGPDEGERPVAYAVLMTEKEPDVNLSIDVGLCAEALILSARERGIGACLFRSFDKDRVSSILGKEGYIPVLVISLGYPKETVVIDDMKDGDIRYYRDSDDRHHVPKLAVDELII